MKAANGHVFKYGDNVDTDVIIPARYLNSSDPKELATHCMVEGILNEWPFPSEYVPCAKKVFVERDIERKREQKSFFFHKGRR